MDTLIISKSFIVKEAVSTLFKELLNTKCLETISDINDIDKNEIKKYDFIFIEVAKDDIKPIETLVEFRKYNKSLKILIFDGKQNINLFINSVKLEVNGYITDILDKEEFEYIAKKIIRGKSFYDGDLVRKSFISKKFMKDNQVLTCREHDVLYQVAKGLSNKEIADNLHITEFTVKKHISSIFSKLNLKSRQDIIIYVSENTH